LRTSSVVFAIGIIPIVASTLIAGGYLIRIISSSVADTYRPIAHFPDNDIPDYTYNSEPVYLSSNEFYIEYHWVWLGEQHGIDDEAVRIFVKDGKVDRVGLITHCRWEETKDFEANGNRVHVYFLTYTHTPYTKTLMLTSLKMTIVAFALLLVGIITISIAFTMRGKRR